MAKKIPPPANYNVGDDPDPTKLDQRGFRTICWNVNTGRWEIFCPPFKMSCVGDIHVTDICGVCDCEFAEMGQASEDATA